MASGGWLRPGVALVAGVVTAAQLGDVGPVSAAVDRDLGLSPAAGGAAISLITLVAAVAAAPVAWGARRWPASRLVVLGLALMAVAGALTAAVAHAEEVFLLLRAVAGLGYVLVVVAGPGLLLGQVEPGRKSWALAWWGGCTPAGLALAAVAGGAGAGLLGWRGWLVVMAAATALAAVAVVRLTPVPAMAAASAGVRSADPHGPSRVSSGWGRALCLAAAFCLIASINLAVASLLPSFLHSARGLSAASAGSLTSLVAISSVPGSVAAGALLRRLVPPPVVGLAVLGCPVAALGFTGTSATISVLANVALVFVAGVGVGAAYGALPLVATTPGALSVANGLLVQLGSLGTLLAPPVFAVATGLDRWSLMPILLLFPALGGAALLGIAAAGRSAPAVDVG